VTVTGPCCTLEMSAGIMAAMLSMGIRKIRDRMMADS